MKNIHLNTRFHSLLLIILLFTILASCEKLLDVSPANKKTRQEFWRVKGDVEAAMVGCYSGLQTSIKSFFTWSEVRGEIIQVVSEVSSSDGWKDNKGMFDVNQQTIDEKNQFAKWGDVYSTINRINTVIKFAPDAQQNDATFSRQELNYYIGECKALRALCYFYLARTFYQFPYITQAAESDDQNFQVGAIDGSVAMDSIISDLLSAEKLVRKNFDTLSFSNPNLKTAYNKGRITLPAVCALLTDVYLTDNQYEKAVEYAQKVDIYGSYQLIPGSQWFNIFYPGNSDEGIFELQYSTQYYNQGDFAKWFANANGGVQWFGNRVNPNTDTYKYWEGDDYQNISTDDLRGGNKTYVLTNKTLIWKWAGTAPGGASDKARNGDSWDAHYIFYRYSDILLMKAEALNQLGQSDEAAQILLTIRQRSGYAAKNISYSSKEDLEDQILDERARELAFEGKRWYDLVRIAKRRNDYTVIAKRIAEFHSYLMNQSIWYGRVSDPLSWYMPISNTELELNSNLTQNPFYKQH